MAPCGGVNLWACSDDDSSRSSDDDSKGKGKEPPGKGKGKGDGKGKSKGKGEGKGKFNLEILAAGDMDTLHRPCVDCGLITGRLCDFCLAQDRDPSARWAEGQHTPLCSQCDNKYGFCHYCRGKHWATPPPHRDPCCD